MATSVKQLAIGGLLSSHPAIQTSIAYYDKAEQAKLEQFPASAQMAAIAGKNIDISTAEFLVYYQFRTQRPGVPGLKDYRALTAKMESSLHHLLPMVDFNGTSIVITKGATPLDVHITERIGEATGLCVVSRIEGLHQADWVRIQVGRYPAMDFQITASSGKYLVQLETKGSTAEDNDKKTSSVSQHRSSIADKKNWLLQKGAASTTPTVRYGTIAVISEQQDQILKCWLLDPPPDEFRADAAKVKLLNRLRYIRDVIAFVSPRSNIVVALAMRIADLEKLNDPWELNRVPLVQGNGEPFKAMFADDSPAPFFSLKSYAPSIRSGGIIAAGRKSVWYFGFVEKLLGIAARQDFLEIMAYAIEPKSVGTELNCVVTPRAFESMRGLSGIAEISERHGYYYRFSREAQLFVARSGLVFGWISTEKG